MKKILAVVAVAGGLACSRSSGAQSSTSTPDPVKTSSSAPAAAAPVAPVVPATAESSAPTHVAAPKSEVHAGRKAISHEHHHHKKIASHA